MTKAGDQHAAVRPRHDPNDGHELTAVAHADVGRQRGSRVNRSAKNGRTPAATRPRHRDAGSMLKGRPAQCSRTGCMARNSRPFAIRPSGGSLGHAQPKPIGMSQQPKRTTLTPAPRAPDQDFFDRPFGHPLQAGHPAERSENESRRADPERTGRSGRVRTSCRSSSNRDEGDGKPGGPGRIRIGVLPDMA